MAEAKTSGANTSSKEKAPKKIAEPVYSAQELSMRQNGSEHVKNVLLRL